MLLFYSLALLLCFYLLAKICDDYFVASLDRIAERLKLSHEVAGASLMAMGSSAPELFVAILSLFTAGGHAEIGMGTIVGSAIFNILVIIGASAIVQKAELQWQPVVRDMLFYSLSIVLLLLVFRDGHIDIWEALALTVFYGCYLIAVMNWHKLLNYTAKQDMEEPSSDAKSSRPTGWKRLTYPLDRGLDLLFPSASRFYWVFTISIGLIALLSWVLVESAVNVAEILGVAPAIIALTVLAAGTSVPDMISSMIVAKQGRGDMAISNAIGSNIFDILFALGVPWLVLLIFSPETTIPVGTENLWSSVILLFATVLVIFFLLIIRKWQIGRYAGWGLIGLYVAYLGWAIANI